MRQRFRHPLGLYVLIDLRLRTYPKTPQPVTLSLSKGGWRLSKAAPFDELRVLS
jgi:hypothetical protein